MSKTDWPNKVLIASKKPFEPKVCQLSGEKFTPENTSDGMNGYQVSVIHPDISTKAISVAACKKCYLEYYKDMYPDALTPKL